MFRINLGTEGLKDVAYPLKHVISIDIDMYIYIENVWQHSWAKASMFNWTSLKKNQSPRSGPNW